MSASASATLVASVQPHEARALPALPDEPQVNDALSAIAVACNGFVYQGDRLEAQVAAMRLLRARPDIAKALGIGQPSV